MLILTFQLVLFEVHTLGYQVCGVDLCSTFFSPISISLQFSSILSHSVIQSIYVNNSLKMDSH